MGRLTGKTALVTGSSRGIGRAVAVRLAEQGALVAVHYTSNEEAARETVTTIEKDGGSAFAVRAELGVPGDVDELFGGLAEGLRERTGTSGLSILVNNAAVKVAGPVEDATPEDFDRLYAVNVKAPFFLIQRALPHLSEGGRVINISSGLTRLGDPSSVTYAMTKGALEQLAPHLAKLLGPRGITINTVLPGATRTGAAFWEDPALVEEITEMSALKRVGEAGDVADVVTFLASDEARWITGSSVDATGGSLVA
ncbi:SDR family NAD(P)-dependent oxidoreductase [Streptomyces daliensis]|uniref:SDR family oxidoreductase n=1 Tax=Streptomyces daliensis TaxID=299421 RepID=A0A8T4IL59_9ACTN|nr:SDR family oxidoreductase [Streptomyces daliensis]